VIPRPAASLLPGNLVRNAYSPPHSGPAETDVLGLGPAICVLTKLSKNSEPLV